MDQVTCSVVWKQLTTVPNLASGNASNCFANEAGGDIAALKNYLSRAKREHIKTNGIWHQLLERVGADCIKSVTRGLGPGRQSAPYPLERAATFGLDEHPLVEHGLVNPRALAIMGAWFLTREIELSLALCKNFTVVTNDGVLKIKWSVAVVRELGCMCQGVQRCSAQHMWLKNISES